MAGESISITRHGQEVARLVPPPEHSSQNFRETIQKIKALREELALKNPEPDQMSIREMIEWGRQ